MSGHRSTMLLLIKSGADVNTRNWEGNTIMDWIDSWQDETILELVEKKFDHQILEDEKLALEKKREKVLELLTKWEEELPEYVSDADPTPVYADQRESARDERDEIEDLPVPCVDKISSHEEQEQGEAMYAI